MTQIQKGKVSVVLPVRYVNRRWLTQSIQSVLDQDYRDLELIVVNDEATENIDDLVKSLGVHKYVRNDRNRKLPYSLNRGFELADGEYHTWTSADNYMLPGMLSTLIAEIHNREKPDVVFANSLTINDNGEVVDDGTTTPRRIATLMRCGLEMTEIPRRYTYISTLGACFLYKSKVWRELGGYNEKLHGAEDYDFWLRAAKTFRIRRLAWDSKALYAYRIHKTSISSVVFGCYTSSRLRVLCRELLDSPADLWLYRAIGFYTFQWLREQKAHLLQALRRGDRNPAAKI